MVFGYHHRNTTKYSSVDIVIEAKEKYKIGNTGLEKRVLDNERSTTPYLGVPPLRYDLLLTPVVITV